MHAHIYILMRVHIYVSSHNSSSDRIQTAAVPGKLPRQWTRYRYTQRLAWFTCNRTSGHCCFTRYIFRMLVSWPIVMSYHIRFFSRSLMVSLLFSLSFACSLVCMCALSRSRTLTLSLSLPSLSFWYTYAYTLFPIHSSSLSYFPCFTPVDASFILARSHFLFFHSLFRVSLARLVSLVFAYFSPREVSCCNNGGSQRRANWQD